jgi:hypothetical protein
MLVIPSQVSRIEFVALVVTGRLLGIIMMDIKIFK